MTSHENKEYNAMHKFVRVLDKYRGGRKELETTRSRAIGTGWSTFQSQSPQDITPAT